MTYKKAFVCEAERNGYKYYKLICNDHYLCDFFDHWSYQLSCKKSFRTVKIYSQGVEAFINYLFEAEEIFGSLDVYGLHDALESFESYLVFGSNSDSKLAKEVATRLRNGETASASTVNTYFAGLNNFLEKSENFRSTLLSLQLRGVKTAINPTDVPLSLYEQIDTPDNIKRAVKESSWMSGCISGGMCRIKKKHLAISAPKSTVIFIKMTVDLGAEIAKCFFLIRHIPPDMHPDIQELSFTALFMLSGVSICSYRERGTSVGFMAVFTPRSCKDRRVERKFSLFSRKLLSPAKYVFTVDALAVSPFRSLVATSFANLESLLEPNTK